MQLVDFEKCRKILSFRFGCNKSSIIKKDSYIFNQRRTTKSWHFLVSLHPIKGYECISFIINLKKSFGNSLFYSVVLRVNDSRLKTVFVVNTISHTRITFYTIDVKKILKRQVRSPWIGASSLRPWHRHTYVCMYVLEQSLNSPDVTTNAKLVSIVTTFFQLCQYFVKSKIEQSVFMLALGNCSRNYFPPLFFCTFRSFPENHFCSYTRIQGT